MSSELQLLLRVRQDVLLLVNRYFDGLAAGMPSKETADAKKPTRNPASAEKPGAKPADKPSAGVLGASPPSEAKEQSEARTDQAAKAAKPEKMSDLQLFFKEISQKI